MTLITGNTYPVKEAIKALGGRWDAINKGWQVPDDKAEEAQALADDAPTKTKTKKKKKSSSSSYRPRVCEDCGARNVKIYRSGECQGCYEERMGY